MSPEFQQLAQLDFPLNVYALAVVLEEGSVDSLHYGFDWAAGPIAPAQGRATEFLVEKLPSPPGSILEVGVGLGALARKLTKLGYAYKGISPDKTQVAWCEQRVPESVFSCVSFSQLDLSEKYDILVFQESAQYIPDSEIIRIAGHVLRPGGSIVLVDEVPAQTAYAVGVLPVNSGFQLEESEDLTSRATGSLDYLIEAIFRHRTGILAACKLPSHKLTNLLDILERRRLAYRGGEFLYFYCQLKQLSRIPAYGQ